MDSDLKKWAESIGLPFDEGRPHVRNSVRTKVKAVKVRCLACGNTFKSRYPSYAKCNCDSTQRLEIVKKK